MKNPPKAIGKSEEFQGRIWDVPILAKHSTPHTHTHIEAHVYTVIHTQ
jgi:hypothetical protein